MIQLKIIKLNIELKIKKNLKSEKKKLVKTMREQKLYTSMIKIIILSKHFIQEVIVNRKKVLKKKDYVIN